MWLGRCGLKVREKGGQRWQVDVFWDKGVQVATPSPNVSLEATFLSWFTGRPAGENTGEAGTDDCTSGLIAGQLTMLLLNGWESGDWHSGSFFTKLIPPTCKNNLDHSPTFGKKFTHRMIIPPPSPFLQPVHKPADHRSSMMHSSWVHVNIIIITIAGCNTGNNQGWMNKILAIMIVIWLCFGVMEGKHWRQ